MDRQLAVSRFNKLHGSGSVTKLLFISITSKCNRSCEYCPMSEWRNNPAFPDSLTLEKCAKAIEFLKPTHVEITGGEPTLVPWLDELCDYLESKGIIYLVKSNGFRRCRNQITAWHDDISCLPKCYGKILIIKDTLNWEEKARHCEENGIPFHAIEHGTEKPGSVVYTRTPVLFLCPDGHLKRCSNMEFAPKIYIDDLGRACWSMPCKYCKAVDDFMIFLED